MEYLPLALVGLACPISMGLMMLVMGRDMRHGDQRDAGMEMPDSMLTDPGKRLAVLQAQKQLLDAQIDAMSETAAPSRAAGVP